MPGKLTPQQRALVRNMVKGMTITDAARAAGYADNGYVGQIGSQALENIKLKMPEVLEKHGLTDDVLIENYLKPLMNAEETKFFQFQGSVVSQENVIAWGPRKEGLDMAFKLKGSYAAKEDPNSGGGVGVVINLNSIPMPADA
jgi:hypothetical protein